MVLDAYGKIAWGRSDIGGDPIVVVLTEKVSDAHLAGLRGEGISYIFAGKTELDLGQALETLNRELGIKRLLLEGGGVANGAFLRAGLVDEISLILFPTVDGAKGVSSIFDSSEAEAGQPAPIRTMLLDSTQQLEGGVMWLRYRLQMSERWRRSLHKFVMPGLVPGIHVLVWREKTWMAGSSPAMTMRKLQH